MIVLKLRDLMTREVFTLPATLSVDEAAWALMHRGVSGAPVRDEEGHLVGVISTSDLVDPERGDTDSEVRTVGDVMTPAMLALDAEDDAADAVQMMAAHGIHRVVVVDAAGSLVGIVTPMDFLRRLLQDGHLEAGAISKSSFAEDAAPSQSYDSHH
jgi:predicted transcriptional regulator